MKIFCTILFLLLGLSLGAQTFKELISIADEFYDSKQYNESVAQYQKAFAIQDGEFGHYYNAACSAALAGDTLVSMQYLKKSAEKGWRNLKHVKTDKDLASVRNSKDWNSILDIIQKNLDEYEKDFDKSLKEKLERIYVKDQMLRQLYREAEEKFGQESDEMKYFWELMSEQDKVNENAVEEIIMEHGWVGKSIVGGQANMALWLVIQHAPLETQTKYLPLLQESVKKGESSGSNLALLEDRILMRKGMPQTFGSQIVPDGSTGNQKVYEVRDPEYVNQRRKEVGLGPIEEYVKRWGIVWDVVQKEE